MNRFYNKVLHVNVSQRSFEEESIDEEVYRKLLGGKGLATHLLLTNTKDRACRSLTSPKVSYSLTPGNLFYLDGGISIVVGPLNLMLWPAFRRLLGKWRWLNQRA